MHDTGCLGLVHCDNPEGGYGEGGGRRDQTKEEEIGNLLDKEFRIMIVKNDPKS